MKFKVVLTAAVAVTFSAGLALAATPFGGDDTGFVTPNKALAKCADGVSKQVGSLVGAIGKCNVKDSDSLFKLKTFDVQTCQNTASAKFDTKTGALTCDNPCVDRNAIRDLSINLTNLNGAAVFCDTTSGTNLDPPANAFGLAFVPANKVTQKCQNGVVKIALKLVGAIGKCHIKNNDTLLKGKPFDEEACEDAAKAKYDAGGTKLTGCPSCIGLTGQKTLRDTVENLLNSNNEDAYCASPSGAFLN